MSFGLVVTVWVEQASWTCGDDELGNLSSFLEARTSGREDNDGSGIKMR